MKQISVQKTTDEKKKYTKTTDIEPNNPVKRISLSSNKMEKEQSGKSTEQPESRKSKEKEHIEERSHTIVTNEDLCLMEEFISLRIVPVVVKNGKVRMKVN